MEKKTITMEISKMITCMMVVTGTTIIISTTTFAQGPDITDSVKIGTQVWTATNLTIASFRNGDMIPEVKSEEDWKKGVERKANFVGGDLLKYWSKCIIELRVEKGKRKAVLVKHRSLPEKELSFEIVNEGIKKRGWI